MISFLFWFFWGGNRTTRGLRSQLTWLKTHLLSQHLLIHLMLVHYRVHLAHHVGEEQLVALHPRHLKIERRVSSS